VQWPSARSSEQFFFVADDQKWNKFGFKWQNMMPGKMTGGLDG
jgi:hypothetical protein